MLKQRMMRVVDELLDGRATPEARLEFGRLLAEAGLVEEAAAATGAAADCFEAAGDLDGATMASLLMAEHLLHLGYHDLAATRLERVLQLADGRTTAAGVHERVQALFTRLQPDA